MSVGIDLRISYHCTCPATVPLKRNDIQTGYHAEVPKILRPYCVAEMQGGRTYHQISEGNHSADLSTFCVDFSRELRHFPGERSNWDRREDGVQVIASFLSQFNAISPVQPVFQLDNCNG